MLAAFVVVLVLALVGCAGVPVDVERSPSRALADPETTTMGRLFADAAERHPGKSGFLLIREGRPAFTSRVALAGLAEKTLDVQYYIWEADTTGRILAEQLVEAADRGIRVRILVDDNNLGGRDAGIAALNAHPNIEVRLFNPFAHRRARLLDFIVDFGRVNHRMHNKVMIADGAAAVVGGRNIGDHYFGVNTEANFRDLDLFAAGPVVRELSNSFDSFWNSRWSFPAEAVVDRAPTAEDLVTARQAMQAAIEDGSYPFPLDDDIELLRRNLHTIRDRLHWGQAEVAYDAPETVGSAAGAGNVAHALVARLDGLQRELLIESAYFVQRDAGVERAADLTHRGVRVRVLTNSLASNDVAAAHGGYEKTRRQLLENGVEIYELRPDSAELKKKWSVAAGKSRASLHTKALLLDRRTVVIGSYNLDPRSSDINTEIVLIIDDPALAAEVGEYMDAGVRMSNSYRLSLDADGDVAWETEVNGKQVRYDTEPQTTFWKRLVADLARILPVESQL